MDMVKRVHSTWHLINWRKIRLSVQSCPVCRVRTVVLRLNENEISIRCLTCRASAVIMSLVSVLNALVPDLRYKSVYEMSSRGPFFRYLKKNAGSLVFSEYFDDIAPGEMNGGVQCQDVEHLTYHSCSVDICTCTEVFEHVPDDMRGFSEVFRVLKPGGMFLFTVPLLSTNSTIERTRRREDGEIEHLLPPEYHGDNIRGRGRVLTYRNYGTDIIVRLKQAGFTDTDIRLPAEPIPWGYARPVVVGRKGGWFEQPSAGRC